MGMKETDSLRLQHQREIGGSTGSPPRAESRGSEFRERSRRADWKSEASRNQLRLDSIPPNDNSAPTCRGKKLELPPTRKDELKAPSKKSGSTIKKEKPKHSPLKVKGAELWRDCPAEFLAAAKAGLVSGRIKLPGSGLLLKEIKPDGLNHKKEATASSKKIHFAPKKLLNNRPKENRVFPKMKGKSK